MWEPYPESPMSSISKVILGMLLLSSCLNEDTFSLTELDPYNKKIVVNTILTNGQEVAIQVSNSASTVGSDFPSYLDQAVVILTQNGNGSTLIYDALNKTYKASVVPQEGDVFTLSVQSPGLNSVNAQARIPQSIQAQAQLIPEGGLDTSGIPSDLLKITFTDDAQAANYYKLNFYYYNTTLAEYFPLAYSITDPDLAEFAGLRQYDGSMVFTDVHFNGETKSLSTVAPFGLVLSNPNEKYLIVLESLSEDLYRYYNSLKDANEAQGGDFVNAFNEAVVIHSNVYRGLGIFGASYRSVHPLQ